MAVAVVLWRRVVVVVVVAGARVCRVFLRARTHLCKDVFRQGKAMEEFGKDILAQGSRFEIC